MIHEGCKILNKKTNITHIVDSIDTYDEVTLIFTCDSKYIPIDDVEIIPNSIIADYFIKILEDKKVDPITEKKSFTVMKKMNIVHLNSYSKEKMKSDLKKFKNDLPNLISSTASQPRIPFFTRFCQWVGFTSF